MRVFKKNDLEANLLRDATVAVLGYGNQGHAHALNLRDSGVHVVVGTRRGGKGWRQAEADGFRPTSVGEAVGAAQCIAVLLPDEIQRDVFSREIHPHLAPESVLVFAHGFSVAFGLITGPEKSDVVLVAPKGQGHYLRKTYSEGDGVPCLVGVDNDASGRALEKALSYAELLGCLSAGAMKTTFRDEAVTDLFGEQVVLCGGVPALVKMAFETLVEKGYPPEVAYIECLQELKIITDLMHEGGISYMRERISRTAAWGSFLAEGKVASAALKSTMESILTDIESGAFAAGWQIEASSGASQLRERIEKESGHPIERAGKAARALTRRS